MSAAGAESQSASPPPPADPSGMSPRSRLYTLITRPRSSSGACAMSVTFPAVMKMACPAPMNSMTNMGSRIPSPTCGDTPSRNTESAYPKDAPRYNSPLCRTSPNAATMSPPTSAPMPATDSINPNPCAPMSSTRSAMIGISVLYGMTKVNTASAMTITTRMFLSAMT